MDPEDPPPGGVYSVYIHPANAIRVTQSPFVELFATGRSRAARDRAHAELAKILSESNKWVRLCTFNAAIHADD